MNLYLMQADQGASAGGFFVPLAIMILLMYFLVLRPQKKREKEAQRMRSSLEVGDSITTVGGIIGIVVSIRDDSVVIETSSDRTKIRITRGAIHTNDTPKELKEEKKEEISE